MKFVQLNVNGQKVLVNLALVTEVQSSPLKGCTLYFNTMVDAEEQSYIYVDESLGEVESMLGLP